MAKEKRAVVLYTDLIHTVDMLSDEEAGKLFKHYLSYVNDQDPEPLPGLLAAVFEPIKRQLKRDLKKYEAKCEKNRQNAEKRWGNKDKKNANDATASDRININANGIRPSAKNADKDIGTGTDSDTDTDNDKKETTTYLSTSVERVYKFSRNHFPPRFLPKNTAQARKWCTEIAKLNQLDGHDFDTIERVIAWGTSHEFWSGNFQTIMKLRKTNAEGVKFMDVFLHRMETDKADQAKLYTYEQMIGLKKYENKWGQFFRPVQEYKNGKPLWAHVDDIEKFNLKTVNNKS